MVFAFGLLAVEEDNIIIILRFNPLLSKKINRDSNAYMSILFVIIVSKKK